MPVHFFQILCTLLNTSSSSRARALAGRCAHGPTFDQPCIYYILANVPSLVRSNFCASLPFFLCFMIPDSMVFSFCRIFRSSRVCPTVLSWNPMKSHLIGRTNVVRGILPCFLLSVRRSIFDCVCKDVFTRVSSGSYCRYTLLENTFVVGTDGRVSTFQKLYDAGENPFQLSSKQLF